MRIKILVLSLVVTALSITLSTASLAYLTDTDESIATFTVGNVSIRTLTASIGRTQQINDEITGEPTIINYTNNDIVTSAEDYATYLTNHCTNMLSGDLSTDTCAKNIFVENTGLTNAYIRVRILVPKEYVSGNSPAITLNTTATDEYIRNIPTEANANCTNPNDSSTCADYEYIFTRINPLSAQQMTTNPVLESIQYNITASTSQQGENPGETISPTLDLTSTNIRVITEAIQAQGFSDAVEAFTNFN